MRKGNLIPVVAFFGLIAISAHWNRELPPSLTLSDGVSESISGEPQSTKAGDSPLKWVVAGRFLPPSGQSWSYRFNREVLTTLNGSPIYSWKLEGRFTIERQRSPQNSFLVHIDASRPEKSLELITSMVIHDDLVVMPGVKVLKGNLLRSETEELAALSRDVVQAYLFPGTENALGKVHQEFQADGPTYLKKVISVEDPDWKVIESTHQLALSNGRFERSHGQDHFMRVETEISTRQEMSYHFEFEKADVAKAWSPSEKTAALFDHVDLNRVRSEARPLDAPFAHSSHAGSYTNEDWRRDFTRLRTSSSLPGMERLRLMKSLARGLRENAAHVHELQNWVKNEKDLSRWKLAVGALLESESAAAETALIDLHDGPNSPDFAPSLVVGAFTVAQRPLQKSTVEWMTTLAPSTTNQEMMLALGSAHRFQTDPVEKEMIRSSISDSLKRAQSPAERVAALDSAGNSGSSEFLPHIQRELSSDDTRVRAHAALALRLQQNDESRDLLDRMASTDPAAVVREAARTALRIQKEITSDEESLSN